MPAVKTKRISTLIESQLPAFISDEYEQFSKFVQKYYEAQEVQGGTLDVINNIQKYADIDYYEKNILKQHDSLATDITNSDTTITVTDAQSFPKKNGYIRIGDEIIFYATRTDTEFQECSRGVSGNTSLGDLYEASNFSSTDAAAHSSGQKVYNVSNLFLYALVKNFENQYLGSFPEKYLRGEIDKRTLIKNIQKFYKAKGTTSSIKFIFNTIVTQDVNDKPEVYKPRDFTYKSSNADWINTFAIKCTALGGDPRTLIGKVLVQEATDEYGYASATVDNVQTDGKRDGEVIYKIILAPETVNGEFAVSTKTRLTRSLAGTASSGDRINVFSTRGWSSEGSVLIGNETITFKSKNATQFIIDERQVSGAQPIAADTAVYKPVTISGSGVTLLSFGVIYTANPSDSHPYSSVGDKIEVSAPGFTTSDPKIVKSGTNETRWVLDQGNAVSVPTLSAVEAGLDQVTTNVTSIHEDDQYYYITSSGYPSHDILDGSRVTVDVLDQNILRLIRKRATVTTEEYKTPKADNCIFLNGVRGYSYKDKESVYYGNLEKITIDAQGRGYDAPPYVLVDQVPGKARAVLSGQVVESVTVDTNDIFPQTPEITITSGREAVVRAIVTGGKVTSLQIDNPGEYYSSAPTVRIRDNAGRGRFASFNAIVDGDGKIVDFEKIDEGNFYTQESVIVDIIPAGSGAVGIPQLKEWNYNRYTKLGTDVDTENGYVFENYDPVLKYGYGYVANPKTLRVGLNDNLNSAGTEPANKTHSPIIGFAYDGNPIYGPFGHENPLDPQSPIVRMTSSYALNGSRSGGPSVNRYPLGTFVNDYTYTHKSGSLDKNNGRICITPEFPQGTYAYFLTIDSNQVPKFPYILGDSFYSLPVDSNYNSNINQNDIPKTAKRFSVPGITRNGDGFTGFISDVSSGNVEGIDVYRSSGNFSVNSKAYFDNDGTEGTEVEALVSSVKGKGVNYLQSKETKVVQLTTIQTAYLFADDFLRQPSSGASGQIVGTVANDNVIVLKDVNGTFDTTGTFSADIKTFSILLDQNSSYAEGNKLLLTNGVDKPIAKGEVLEGTNKQNIVTIKVLDLGVEEGYSTTTTSDWRIDDDYFIQSESTFDTTGTRLVRLTSLSDGLEPFIVDQSVALIETDAPHGLGIGDDVTISINPDDTTKTKTYYLRKRLYQEAVLQTPVANTTINDTGVGRFQLLNSGADYTAGTYNNVPLTGGTGTGATATIVVSGSGLVSSVTIQAKGSGYSKADYLGVADESLVRSSGSLSNQRLILYVDHVGFGAGSNALIVDDPLRYANGDLIKIGEEVLEITNISDSTLTVLTAREGTKAVDHFDGQAVSLYKPKYNFDANFQIFTGNNSGYIQSYDRETQKIQIVYDYATLLSNAQQVGQSSSFFDNSTPSRQVKVFSAGETVYKFEFSEDNTTFTPNPNIDIQEFYKYVFDTSHSSLTGTYFDLSPSRSLNLETVEKTASTILPGNPGAFTEVKFGFGSRLASNNYSTKTGTDFTNFYYYDRKNVVTSGGAYLKIITDPLQGTKKVTYVTSNRFVYAITATPLFDGSGSISYTTTGQFAVGEINSFLITNLGLNYKKVPVITGVDPSPSFKATGNVLFDLTTQNILDVEVTARGSNYVNPKVVIVDGDGTGAKFSVTVVNGEIYNIKLVNPGKGYTYKPEIEIIEGDTELYATSTNIGVPRSVSIINNGAAYHLDKTVASTFSSSTTFYLKDITEDFIEGEIIVQRINGTEVARATVVEWRSNTNLLKVGKIIGTFRQNQQIVSLPRPAITATVTQVFVSTFTDTVKAFYDNSGYFKSDKGRIGNSNQRITDSNFYQDYSYVVKSKTPIDQWRELIKSTTHPAGFKLFGQVDVEVTAGTEMPEEMPKASHFSVIQLWDPEKNKITVESTHRVVTQSIQKIENQRIKKAVGSAATSEFNFNEMRAFPIKLGAPFDGYYDTDGRLQGTTSFQIKDLDNVNVYPYSAYNLIISLDGVLQEPGLSYTISGDRIIFSQPPLGPNSKQTGNAQTDVTDYLGVTFYGKYVAFKKNSFNDTHFRKVRNIFQRGGRWIDAANQIERNTEFIIEETIGWGKATYPTLDWSTKQDDYERNIRSIVAAYDHDVRFGGNVKTTNYVEIFNTDDEFLYIQNNRTESTAIFDYASRLAKLAIRNWDWTDIGVNYIQGSAVITLTDTANVAVGMYVSSGRAFHADTKIVSIDSDTQVTVSRAALANSGGGGGAPQGTTLLSGTASTGPIATSTGAVAPGNTFSVPPGVTVTAPISFSGTDQATFSLSGINNGTFYDAGNLIAANKAYIQEETVGWAQANYPGVNWNAKGAKCERDLGFLVDAFVYHLKFGGNQKVVEFGQLYYEKAKYPYSENLLSINNELTESLAAFEYAKDLMVLAMRNTLAAGTYTSITPVIDNTILVDSQTPYCSEVESALDTYYGIVDTILSEGRGLVTITPQNPNRAGNWSRTLTYSNYNIIEDPLLLAQECDDVISSVDSLFGNISTILAQQSVTQALPDFIDGETKEFELYWDNNDPVNVQEDEDLFVTLNAVLQRPKYTEDYPGEDAYFIDRSVIPNKIKFDVAPIWDQDLGAKTIGEPTAVEKVSMIGVGNYKRLTIDYQLVDGVKSGPFLILDVEDYKVQSIESKDNLYVFLDGVLQREGYSYTVAGPNIYFNVPIQKEVKIDMRYLYGRDVGQILNLYDYSPDTYYARGVFTINGIDTGVLDEYTKYQWMGDKIGFPIQAWQVQPSGLKTMIGEVSNYYFDGTDVTWNLKTQNAVVDPSITITFAVAGAYDRTFTIDPIAFSNASIVYETDDDGRKLLRDDNAKWFGTVLRKSYRNPFVYLSNGDKIRVEGEKEFRSIKQLPEQATAKEGRNNTPLSNEIYGAVNIESYTGVTRGEGLSVIANIENGVVVSLTWNQRSFDPITQPTAYGYFTPPVLKFIPADGQGGGAKAHVLVEPLRGQILSVDLIDGGSGYTEAPLVVVSRRFDILQERDIGVSLVNLGINTNITGFGMSGVSTIDTISDAGINAIDSISSVTFGAITDATIKINRQLTPDEIEVFSIGGTLDPKRDYVEIDSSTDPLADNVQVIDVFYDATEVASGVQSVQTFNSVSTVSRAITQIEQIEIPNNAISNVNFFEVGAYLQVDLDPTDNVVYVADTAKFTAMGQLLIGNEMVEYARKINDRFLNVTRGRKGTTPQFWAAGTFLRQIPEVVSVASVGIVTIESESDVTMVSASATAAAFERRVQRQVAAPADFSINVVTPEMVITPPPGGVIDGYQETAFINDPLIQRNGNAVDLIDVDGQYSVVKRDTTEVEVFNSLFRATSEYVGQYTRTNAGHTISMFDGIFDPGFANVSGYTLADIDFYFPSLRISDFAERGDSSYTQSGIYFNYAPPSIQNPVTTTITTGTVPATLIVQDTTHFPSAGYLFTTSGSVIQYTGKQATSFTGCTLFRGPDAVASGDDVIPFTIS